MNTYIGIDLGTSAAKFLLVDEDGKILSSVSEKYEVSYPREGWSEQNPADWISAVKRGVSALLKGRNRGAVRGIGAGGQMHGLVALDGRGEVIRPCILWNDGRTERQTEYLNNVVGKRKLSDCTANIAFAGFTAPKLLWLKENEPENFEKIRKILLPKDYVNYFLTGGFNTDLSDASGTLLLDVKNRNWSGDMCRLTGISNDVLPELHESYEAIGKLRKELCELWGLKDVTVCAGAGDNAAAAIGTGTVGGGSANISLGTSGTLFVSKSGFSVDEKNALHSFCHADGRFHLMGCILSAASCNSWWLNVLSSTDFDGEQRGLEKYLGENNVYFLPYLSGERSPHNDVNARGAFLGLSHTTSRGQMSLAVLEGVAFALNDCLEIARADGEKISRSKICGGGAKSALWRRIIANVCNLSLEVPAVEEGPAYGAAILSMVASGAYKSVDEACAKLAHTKEIVEPEPELTKKYAERYDKFRRIYPALKGIL